MSHDEVTETVALELARVRIDGGTQSRAAIDDNVVQDYAEALAEGTSFPPVKVFYDGTDYWLADGFHRHCAHERQGLSHIDAEVRQGTRRDAVLFSVGANGEHGLRRNNADKRRAVFTLLQDAEWSQWSDREIARQCQVSNRFVSNLRPSVNGSQIDERKVQRAGSTYTQNTAAIGKPVTPPTEINSTAEQVRAELPEAIKGMEQARAARRAQPEPSGLSDEQRVAELEEHVREVEAENADLKAENAKFSDMKVLFDAGGFEKVVAEKDEQIRVLTTRVERESGDKVKWANQAKFWRAEAHKLGYSADIHVSLADDEEGGAGA